MGKCIDNPKYDKPANAIQNTWKHTHSIEKPKQETLEEVVKITQSKMYSEDEIRRISYNAYCLGQLNEPTENKFNGWFETIKKK